MVYNIILYTYILYPASESGGDALKNNLHIGLCGFGFMGKTHLFAVRNLPFFCTLPFSADVTGLCTSHPDACAAAAAEWDIPKAFASEADMIADPDIDVIDICTPNPCHFETARAALAAGKHVLCEKPLTVTAAEADELVRLADASGLVCGTVYNNRFLPPVIRARQLIGEGRLGRVLSFDFAYRHNSDIDPDRRVGWKQTAAGGGGTLYDLGPHALDLCRLLCGDICAVTGKSQIAFPTHLTPDGGLWQTDADEAFYLIARTTGGAVGTVTLSKLTQGENDGLTFSIYGTDGALRFDLMDPDYLYFYDAHAPGTPVGGLRGYTRIECVGRFPAPASGFPSAKAPIGWLRGHVGALADFLSAVYDGRQPSAAFSDGAAVMHVMEAAGLSDREGREVLI